MSVHVESLWWGHIKRKCEWNNTAKYDICRSWLFKTAFVYKRYYHNSAFNVLTFFVMFIHSKKIKMKRNQTDKREKDAVGSLRWAKEHFPLSNVLDTLVISFKAQNTIRHLSIGLVWTYEETNDNSNQFLWGKNSFRMAVWIHLLISLRQSLMWVL